MKKFSIIIPVYNTEKYLNQCLNSVLNQKFNQEEYEVIIVNDGSTDNSIEVINKFKNKFKNFRLINRENKGVLFSRIEAVKNADGEYILFLDSDDYLPEDCLEKYSNEINNGKYDIVRGNYYTVNKDNIETKFIRYKQRKEIQETKKMYEGILKSENYNSIGGQVLKKDIINTSRIDYSISMGDDVEINYNCYLNAKSIMIINDCIYCYRQNPDSLTHTISINRLKQNILDIENVYSRLIENVKKLNDKELSKLSYAKYLSKKHEYNYLLIKNSNDNKIISEMINISFNSKYLIDAKNNLKYKEIFPRKKRFFIYLMLCNKKKMYINILKLISKLKK